ncbi:flagellar biosynthetic protein FliO [Parasphingorhabdus sp. JC815]|uniref:FliO/MopB family protein n=1 Tax=Parasphingorhabdus sp. JC815 TaxID=3232140 RepID=UPI003459CAC9
MAVYILKLLILLPVMCGLIFAALWLYRKYQPALIEGQKQRGIKMLETLPLGNFAKLVIIEFGGRKILLSVTRGRVERIAANDDAS